MPGDARKWTLRQGFTLVELMVVIAIIATLISILLPSLGAIRTQVKVSTTKVTVSTLETGIHQFQAETRIGGSLPPSSPPIPPIGVSDVQPGEVISPHASGSVPVVVNGASLLFWALAGADMLGTPGFEDLDGDGTWANDTGSALRAPRPAPLYSLNGTSPAHSRSGPYVDVSKMRLPERITEGYKIPAAVGVTLASQCVNSPCFLDSFGQPILYYRANANKEFMVDKKVGAANTGIYTMADNAGITNGSGTCHPGGHCDVGMDLGRGPINAAGYFHYAGLSGEVIGRPPAEVLTWLRTTPVPDRYSFAYTVWNPSVNVVPRPYNDKSFILLSAGADGVFGTPDDMANFEVNK